MSQAPHDQTSRDPKNGRSRTARRKPGDVEAALRERVKELHCLYGITRLAQRRDLPLEALAASTAELVRASWQFPEIAYAAVTLDGRRSATPNEAPALARQTAAVTVHGEAAGLVEVGYLEARPRADEGPFLREERHLIDAVADLLGRIVEQRRAEERMRDLSRELIMAQENERQRIAGELHDNLAQDLAMARQDLEQLRGQAATPTQAEQLDAVAARLSGAIASIRDLAYDLLPLGLAELGLVEAVAAYCGEFSRRHGLEVEVFADGLDKLVLDFDAQVNLHRLVQEALTNARKHAKASKVTVRLIGSYPRLLVRVEDDGQGADLDKRLAEARREKRMGLWSMRERIRLLGGAISFHSKPGAGMRILAEVPCTRRRLVPKKTHPAR